MSKYFIVIGNFGSGKTEIAINFALHSSGRGRRTEIIDLDMVNTYFRLSERRELFEENGIRLVSPNYVSTNIETLSLPAEVMSAFHMDWDTVVFDVGGDPAGATALGRFHREFSELDADALEVLNVVNVRRPMSGTADKIVSLMHEMQDNCRLAISGFINNTNLAHMTSAEELRDGYEILREVSQKTGVPVAYTTGRRELLDAFLSENPDSKYVGTPLAIETYMHRDWETFTRRGV